MADEDDQTKPISLFYSYSHKDEDLRRKLEIHLAALRRSRLIAEWHDRKLEPGDAWKDEIDRYLMSADIVLLLVSADFFNSDYCWGEEMTKALERHGRGETRVIPVILRHCRWQSTPLASLQVVPRDAKPIKSWSDEDEAFDDVVAAIERAVRTARQRAEEQARRRAEEEARRHAHEQKRQRAEEQARQRAEEEARRHAHEQERQRADEEAKRGHKQWSRTIVLDGQNLVLTSNDPACLEGFAKAFEAGTPKEQRTLREAFFQTKARWCPELVVIPAGSFVMGSPKTEKGRSPAEGPQHEVRSAQSFALGKYPVTVGEYDYFCVKTKRQKPSDEGWGRGERPVINVSWNDAQAYCAWISKQTGQRYRLPSEAEWEYACRAGTTTPFWTGETISTVQANYCRYADGPGRKGEYGGRTTLVDTFNANPWGLYDMHGNVWEWCEDCWHGSFEGEGRPDDGTAWTTGDCSRRVLRGGSWQSSPENLRSARREGYDTFTRHFTRGFRVARTLVGARG